ncbi:MAG: TonB-dependent receptor [Alphaproteobacteria bacterium]|nr:TonB-dependent receptor [Alphaproteobacteria bacterium]
MGAAVAALAPAALVATSAFAPAFAQDFTSGGLDGNVADASGAAVGGASVSVTSNAQGFTRTTTSSSGGTFRLSGLPQGSYTVVVTSSAGTSTLDNVRVIAGTSTNYTFVVGAVGDEIVVSGTRQNLDFANTTVGVTIDLEELVKTVPIARNITAVTLLAPGTVLGDSAFSTLANGGQNLPAIGGSSVGENVYYINGLNLTNFDNGLGGSVVPFEFYSSVEVKTGGYPAEFGRATGGIINAVTKSGTNDWKASVHVNWSPDALRSDSPDTILQANRADERELFSTILEVGGPLIKDRLFVYGLMQLNDNKAINARNASPFATVDKSSDPFWGFKVDGYLTDEHHLEFTYFDTSRKTTRDNVFFDNDNGNVVDDSFGTATATTLFENGGASFVGKYTGSLTDWLTLSVAYGQNDDKGEQIPGSALSRVRDRRTGTTLELSPNTTTSVTRPRTTDREFIRADIDVLFEAFGDHHLRFGFDKENLLFNRTTVRNGPANGQFGGLFPVMPTGSLFLSFEQATAASPQLGGTSILFSGDDYVELNYFNSGGSFEAENTAFYIQDEWDVTDRLTLNLGVRLDQFSNFTADGSQFIDFNKEIGPRLGFSYDVFGDGRGKFFGNYGVYYLPVASNTAFRQGAQEFFFREFWTFDPTIGANGIPVLDTQIQGFPTQVSCPFNLTGASSGTGCLVSGDGSVQDPTASISGNLEATKETEFLVGYEQQLNDLWTVGVTYLNRRLNTTAEDIAVDDYINNYCDDPANGVDESVTDCSSIWSGFHQYTIINPGNDSTITFSELLPGETSLRTVTFTAAQIGLDKAERKYDSIQFSFNRAFDGVWSVRGSYTWSNSRGNTEGFVQSDFGQTDAGLTQDYDKTGFQDGSFGKLPNHRAHEFKVWGGYKVTEELSFGTNISVRSPRKFGCFGLHPDAIGLSAFDPALRSPNGPGVGLNLYGAASHFCNLTGTPGGSVAVPRGTGPESDWIANVDMSARYDVELPTGTVMTLRADVFNIFNFDGVSIVDEFGETGSGLPRPAFGTPLRYQAPRSVRFGLDINF